MLGIILSLPIFLFLVVSFILLILTYDYYLLLGSGESGKSTILKQMKIINQNGYTKQELFTWRVIVYRNIVESAQALTQAIADFRLDFELHENKVRIHIEISITV